MSTYAEVGLRRSLLMFIVVKQLSSDVYSSKGVEVKRVAMPSLGLINGIAGMLTKLHTPKGDYWIK